MGDLVDGKSLYDGTWWEGKIVKITLNPNPEGLDGDDGFLYHFVDERQVKYLLGVIQEP